MARRMKVLPIVWKRLVSPQVKTCDRCEATHREIRRAVSTLRKALRPLGIRPTVEAQVIRSASFRADPSESNRVWIAGKPMEAWRECLEESLLFGVWRVRVPDRGSGWNSL